MSNKKGRQPGSPKQNNCKRNNTLSLSECIAAFIDDMRANGIQHPPTEIIADGELHVFSPTGKKGDTAGRYVFHLDGIPSGYYQDYRQGLKVTWSAGKDHAPAMTPAEQQAFKKRLRQQAEDRRAKQAEKHRQAAKTAQEVWRSAKPANPNHPYLLMKGVQPHNLLELEGDLIVPLHDTGGNLHSIQRIGTNGFKMMLKGGRKRGNFSLIGAKLHELDRLSSINLAEGWASSASVYEAYGAPVIVGIDSGNLLAVVENIRKRWPYLVIVIYADNDRKAEAEGRKNVGVESAKAVADQFTGVFVEVPSFPESAPIELSDFNDLIQWRKSQNGGVL